MPPTLFAPPHVHLREDEWPYVVEGQLTVMVGADTFQPERGEMVFMPRRVPHAAANASAQPARLLMLVSPAGFEAFVEEMAKVRAGLPPLPAAAVGNFPQVVGQLLTTTPQAAPVFDALTALWAKYGVSPPE